MATVITWIVDTDCPWRRHLNGVPAEVRNFSTGMHAAARRRWSTRDGLYKVGVSAFLSEDEALAAQLVRCRKIIGDSYARRHQFRAWSAAYQFVAQHEYKQ